MVGHWVLVNDEYQDVIPAGATAKIVAVDWEDRIGDADWVLWCPEIDGHPLVFVPSGSQELLPDLRFLNSDFPTIRQFRHLDRTERRDRDRS